MTQNPKSDIYTHEYWERTDQGYGYMGLQEDHEISKYPYAYEVDYPIRS